MEVAWLIPAHPAQGNVARASGPERSWHGPIQPSDSACRRGKSKDNLQKSLDQQDIKPCDNHDVAISSLDISIISDRSIFPEAVAPYEPTPLASPQRGNFERQPNFNCFSIFHYTRLNTFQGTPRPLTPRRHGKLLFLPWQPSPRRLRRGVPLHSPSQEAKRRTDRVSTFRMTRPSTSSTTPTTCTMAASTSNT